MPRRGGDSALGWAQLAQQARELDQLKWEHSPEFLDQKLRTIQNARNVQAGLEQRDPSGAFAAARAQEMEQRLAPIRLKAQLDAENFETRYTAKDKANIAKLRNQQRQAFSMLQAGEISQEDYDKAVKIAKNKELGIIPGDLPSLSPYPKGQNRGDVFWSGQGDDRVLVRRVENGDTVPVDMSKTYGWQAKQQELEATKEKAKIDAEERKAKEKYRLELLKTQVPDTDPNNKTGTRYLTDQEVQDRFNRAYPSEEYLARKQIEQMRQDVGLSSVTGQPARISSDADYAKLPSGTMFVGPDGKTRRKP